MAELLGTITVQNTQYRPCWVNGKKALFHTWEQWSDVIPPSPMIGGHNGGTIQETVGIVEYEDGTVSRVEPTFIRFADNLVSQYDFGEEK